MSIAEHTEFVRRAARDNPVKATVGASGASILATLGICSQFFAPQAKLDAYQEAFIAQKAESRADYRELESRLTDLEKHAAVLQWMAEH